MPDTLQEQIKELREQLAQVTRDRDQWRLCAKAVGQRLRELGDVADRGEVLVVGGANHG